MFSINNKRALSQESQEMQNRLMQGYENLRFSSDGCPVLLDARGEESARAFQDLLFDHYESNKFKNRQTVTAERRGGGVPFGGTPPSERSRFVPPLTNRGGSKYRKENNSDNQTANVPFSREIDESIIDYYQKNQIDMNSFQNATLGGYDGGVEVGFCGKWKNNLCFFEVLEQLDKARKIAESQGNGTSIGSLNDECFVTLGGWVFKVEPHGCHAGLYYRYVFTGRGIKFYIHHNPNEKMQAVRLRYNYDALTGRCLFDVHAKTREWLERIGFQVTKETVSRVDIQVTLQRPVSDFTNLIFNDHAVCKPRKDSIHRNCSKVETYTAGKETEICIYDKKRELLDGRDERKIQVVMNALTQVNFSRDVSTLNLCVIEHFTRVEFRLRRSRLRLMGINNIDDLREKELSLVSYLSEEWFRILAEPKIRGHENTQEVHAIWKEVQELFRKYFPGDDAKRSEIQRVHDNEIRCTGESLLQQSDGCLASALAVNFGSDFSVYDALMFLFEYVWDNKDNILQRARQRARDIEIMQNVTLAKCQLSGVSSSPMSAFKPPKVIDAFDARAALDDTVFHAVLESWGMAYRTG
jgi:hypothetical protein